MTAVPNVLVLGILLLPVGYANAETLLQLGEGPDATQSAPPPS
jgi:hypothetical protein